MAFDGPIASGVEESARRANQRSHRQTGQIHIADFLRNFDEEREYTLRQKYLEEDLAAARRFGAFKSYILFASEGFERDLRREIDQINNVINALERDDPEAHEDIIEELRDARNGLVKRKKRQTEFRDDVDQITDPKDYNSLEEAFKDLQKEMSAAKTATQEWRDNYKNYWENPGAYFAHRAKAKDKAMPAMFASAPPTGKNGKPPKHPKADEWNDKLEKLLKTKLIALSKVTDNNIIEREFTFLHDMFGEKLVDKGLASLHAETNEAKYDTMRQTFANIVTKLHSKQGYHPTGP